MPPTFLLLGVQWRFPLVLPIPMFLLWPFLWLAMLVARAGQWIVSKTREEAAFWPAVRNALSLYSELTGLKVQVRSSDGVGFYLWFI